MSWIAAAAWSGADFKRRNDRVVWLSYGLIAASILVPPLWRVLGWRPDRWWNVGAEGAYALALATLPGFLFAWWARLHLGHLWSAAITRKADHRIVKSGPYAVVRHPIYTGILWAALVTDGADATNPAALSFVALFAGFWLKARAEEGFLRNELGHGAYEAYRRRVPMLIPWSLARGRARAAKE